MQVAVVVLSAHLSFVCVCMYFWVCSHSLQFIFLNCYRVCLCARWLPIATNILCSNLERCMLLAWSGKNLDFFMFVFRFPTRVGPNFYHRKALWKSERTKCVCVKLCKRANCKLLWLFKKLSVVSKCDS